VLGGDAEVQPGWPKGAQHLSILLEEISKLLDEARRYKIEFWFASSLFSFSILVPSC
jgi:hypothetical protein